MESIWDQVGNFTINNKFELNPMNQKTIKNIGLLAILSLVTVSLSGSFLTEAEARGVVVTSSIEDDQFKGHSGNSAAAQTPEPSAKALQVAQAQADTEAVSLSLEEFEFDGKSTNVSNDASSVSTKGFVPRADDFGLETFEAIYRVANSGDGDVRNIEILVSSDTETVTGQLSGKLDVKHSVIAVEIKAVDPASISAQIISFEI
ncbi:MAG: hypothetical protein NPMRTH4_2260007 [Nitrosopumilales archaeon]|nr:MAG: hypothetical protein NPMRTH4_2260007 [Nitrosopumilales archaeon]